MSTTTTTNRGALSDAQMAAHLGIDPNTGRPLSKNRATVMKADLRTTLKQLWDSLLKVRTNVDELAVAKGLAVEVPDEPRGPQYAAPTPWIATNDDGIDGRARGDDRIEARRRMLELERKLNAMPFADREGRAGAALRKEIDDLRVAEREARYRRDFGPDGLGGASPLGAQSAGPQYAEPTPWDATQFSEGNPQVPTLQPMTDAEAERLRAEAIRLQGLIEDTQTPFTERTKASTKLAEIEAKLRAAGKSTELGRAGGPRPQP